MHRVEEHAGGLGLDGRDVGVRFAAELRQRSLQRGPAADIDQIEAVVDRVHVGEELGEGAGIERPRHGKRVAAAGARPIGQRRVADRLQIDIGGGRDELGIGAAGRGGDADQPLLRHAALSPRARSRNVRRVRWKITEDRRGLADDHAGSCRHLDDGERVGEIRQGEHVADLFSVQSPYGVRPGEEATNRARDAVGIGPHILRQHRGAHHAGGRRRREGLRSGER